MSDQHTIDDGGSAFPIPGTYTPSGICSSSAQPGMSLRMYLAAQAAGPMMLAAAIIKNEARNAFEVRFLDDVVRASFRVADAMIFASKTGATK